MLIELVGGPLDGTQLTLDQGDLQGEGYIGFQLGTEVQPIQIEDDGPPEQVKVRVPAVRFKKGRQQTHIYQLDLAEGCGWYCGPDEDGMDWKSQKGNRKG